MKRNNAQAGFATLTYVLFMSALLLYITLYSFDDDRDLEYFILASEKHYTLYFSNISKSETAKLDALLQLQ